MYKLIDITIGIIIFLVIVILIGYAHYYIEQFSMYSRIASPPPYITQSLVINIYATNNDYPKYAFLFKGALKNNIRVINRNGIVLVPRTTTNIPIQVFSNASKTRFSIIANGIEQEIQECDFIATTY